MLTTKPQKYLMYVYVTLSKDYVNKILLKPMTNLVPGRGYISLGVFTK